MQAPLVAQQEKRRSGFTAMHSRGKAGIDDKKFSHSLGLPLFLQAKLSASQSSPNQAGMLLQRKCACGSPASSLSEECADCGSRKPFALQTKLKIGEPEDIYEQEADRIADQVLAKSEHLDTNSAPLRIQRYTGQATGQGDVAPASVDHVLAGSGRPLEPALRQDMEHRFGHDFSRVRVHSDAAAERSAQDVNAHAYTVGHSVVFGAGRFAPETHEGRRLIAHELTHMVQQSGAEGVRFGQSNIKRGLSPICPEKSVLQRQPLGHSFSSVRVFEDTPLPFQAKLAISQPGDRYEREADRVADAVMRMVEPQAHPGMARAEDAVQGEKPRVETQPVAGHITPLMQRELGGEEEQDDDERVQPKQRPEQTSTATSALETGIRSWEGGQPLDVATRSFFEPRFGHDFGQVRVHTGSKAHDLASAIQARAFTLGRDIVFAQGEYTPGDNTGRRLLAHELTHVVQQQHSPVSRTIFRTPSVDHWDFRNGIGDTTSDKNCCEHCQPPYPLGLDVDDELGYFNCMELGALIQNHAADATYDVKRVKHSKTSEMVGGTWSVLKESGPDADDDKSERDECKTPQFSMLGDYIYSIDRPGFKPRNIETDPDTTDVVYMANFTESVRITQSGTTIDDPTTFDWHSVNRAVKVDDNVWDFDFINSEIDPGHLKSLDP